MARLPEPESTDRDTFCANQPRGSPQVHTLTVELGDRSYPIVIGQGLLAGGFDLRPYLSGSDCLIVTNTTVGPVYGTGIPPASRTPKKV